MGGRGHKPRKKKEERVRSRSESCTTARHHLVWNGFWKYTKRVNLGGKEHAGGLMKRKTSRRKRGGGGERKDCNRKSPCFCVGKGGVDHCRPGRNRKLRNLEGEGKNISTLTLLRRGATGP